MSIKYNTATWNIIEKFFYDNPDKVVEMGNKARIKAINTVSFDAVARRITSFCNNIKSN
jgi:hypothetical protein